MRAWFFAATILATAIFAGAAAAQSGRFAPDNPWFQDFEAACRTPGGVIPQCEGGVLDAYANFIGTTRDKVRCDFLAFWRVRDADKSQILPVLPWQNGVEILVEKPGVCEPI